MAIPPIYVLAHELTLIHEFVTKFRVNKLLIINTHTHIYIYLELDKKNKANYYNFLKHIIIYFELYGLQFIMYLITFYM